MNVVIDLPVDPGRRPRSLASPLLIALIASAALAALQSVPASAHGPCQGCTSPQRAEVGETIRVDYPTYLAIWNPERPVLTKGPKPNCYGCQLGLWKDHVEGVGATVIFEHRPRVPEFSFKVPDVPPGRYLVALFDGSESAGHYSWNFVTVEESESAPGRW